MKKRIFSFFCACLLLFTALSSLGTFATEPEAEDDCPTVEELVSLARLARHYVIFLREGVLSYWQWYSWGFPLSDFMKWMISKGLLPQTLETKDIRELSPLTDRHTGQIYEDDLDLIGGTGEKLYYALPEGITIEKLKEEYYNLFYYDNYEIFECTRKHPVYGQPGGRKCYKDYFRLDDSGRVYTNSIELGILPEEADFWENEDMWNSARITFKDSQKIILTMHYELPYGQVEGDVTVEYRKTPNGWRVYNGDIVSDGWGEPPETGDNTPIFLTLTALSVFGLVALAVTVGRKKKERL